ncbi:MAG: hypothetical protein MZV64_50365 [Ignavibacteriales bacterium]|nr:hypothetical protein [Ignavibacteriales bacterium]
MNYAEAASAYEQTITICKQIGDEGMELQVKAEQQLPGTYFNLAKGSVRSQKLTAMPSPILKKQPNTLTRWVKQRPRMHRGLTLPASIIRMGNTDLKNDALDTAIEKYNKALVYKDRLLQSLLWPGAGL